METFLKSASEFVELQQDSPPDVVRSNNKIAENQMLSLLHVRLHILHVFLKCALASPGGLQDIHKHQWLLLQLSPTLLTPSRDLFWGWMLTLRNSPHSVIQSRMNDVHRILSQDPTSRGLFIVIDETQQLLAKKFQGFFRSSTSGDPRPILRPYLGSLMPLLKRIIVSGTGLSMSTMEEVAGSVVSKEGDSSPFKTITNTGFFDTRAEQTEYLGAYIPKRILETAPGKALQSRINYWLHGR